MEQEATKSCTLRGHESWIWAVLGGWLVDLGSLGTHGGTYFHWGSRKFLSYRATVYGVFSGQGLLAAELCIGTD